MRRAALAALLANRARLALTLITVVLASAFVAAAVVVSSSLSEGRQPLRAGIDILVVPSDRDVAEAEAKVSQGGQGSVTLSATQRANLAELPGVTAVAGLVEGYATVAGRDGTAVLSEGFDVRMTGSNWTGTDRMSLVRGTPPRDSSQVVLLRTVAEQAKLDVGDRTTVLHGAGRSSATVVGIYDYLPTGREAGAPPAVAFDTTTAHRLLLRPGEFSGAEITVDGAEPSAAVRAAVADALPDGMVAVGRQQLAADLRTASEQATASLSATVLVFTGIAVLVGITLIVNTFSMLVARRSREFALLRAVGASRRQVRRSVLLEAGVLGGFGSAIGLLVGCVLAIPVLGYASSFDPGLTGELAITPLAVLITLLVGTGTTLLAAWLPARKAAALSPVAALGGETPEQAAGSRWSGIVALGLAVLAALLLLLATLGTGFGNRAAGMLGALTLLLSVVLGARRLAGPLLGVFVWPLRSRPLAGLAARNAGRNPRRTAATTTALTLGIAIATGVAILGSTIAALSERDLVGELAARTVVTNTAGGQLDAPTIQRIRALPEVDSAEPIRTDRITVDGEEILGASIPQAAVGRTVNLPLVRGEFARGVLVKRSLAEEKGLAPGALLELSSVRGGSTRVPVAGVYEQAQLLGEIVLPPALADTHFRAGEGNPLAIAAASGVEQTALRTAVRSVLAGRGDLAVLGSAEYVRSLITEVDVYLGAVTGMLGLSILMAFLGVINTLSLSVTERRREVGLLRSIGATRRQVRRLIRMESLLIALVGGVLGVLIGVILGAAMQNFIIEQGIFSLVVPLPAIGLAVLGIAVGGVLAAALPAHRAARTSVLHAVAAE